MFTQERAPKLEVTGINDLDKTAADMIIEISNSKGRTVFQKELTKEWKHGVSTLFQVNLATKNWKGNYSVKVSMMSSDGTILTENSYPFDVFREKDLRLQKTTVALMDPNSPLAGHLKRQRIKVVDFNSAIALSVPVFVTNTKAETESEKKNLC